MHSLSALSGAPLWGLTQEATRLRLQPRVPSEVREATAALQDLAGRFVKSDVRAGRIARRREIQGSLKPSIQSQANGPYLVTSIKRLGMWLGESIPTLPQMALYRRANSPMRWSQYAAHPGGQIDQSRPLAGRSTVKCAPERRSASPGSSAGDW
jgi:hypothetical protein